MGKHSKVSEKSNCNVQVLLHGLFIPAVQPLRDWGMLGLWLNRLVSNILVWKVNIAESIELDVDFNNLNMGDEFDEIDKILRQQ